MDTPNRYSEIINKAYELSKKGISKPCLIGGEVVKSGLIFMTDVFTIKADNMTKRLEIVKNDNKNPVLCINADGKVYRTHGEINIIKQDIISCVE